MQLPRFCLHRRKIAEYQLAEKCSSENWAAIDDSEFELARSCSEAANVRRGQHRCDARDSVSSSLVEHILSEMFEKYD